MVDGIRAKVHDGKIYISAFNRRFEFELNNKDHRKSKEYKDWRKQVFDRDLYTCKKCGQIGGNLNAHHIKEFAKYPKLRYEVNNGITLCESCHKKIHKKKG